HHTGYFDVTAEGQPSDTIFSFSFFSFPEGIKRGEVEEEIEFFDPSFEPFSGSEMPHFMQDDQQ
ncbi:MAG: hypothetical protein RIQ78_584, partial [Bacteroidota bacterium]